MDVKENDGTELTNAASNMVIAVAIDIYPLQFYQSGIYTGNCSTSVNHTQSIVGYGNDNGTLYWILRNQWGPNYGEQGYIRLQRDLGKGPGKCGVNMIPSYPTV